MGEEAVRSSIGGTVGFMWGLRFDIDRDGRAAAARRVDEGGWGGLEFATIGGEACVLKAMR